MADLNPSDVDSWVDDKMAALHVGGWQPEAAPRLADLRTRRDTQRTRRIQIATAAVAVNAVFIAVPSTRALGARCVGACLNATARVTQYLRADEPLAGAPPTVGV